MIRLLLVAIITTFSTLANAVDLLDGYIVMPNNDTINCKIKGGRFLSTPFYGITVVDDQGQEQSYHAKDKKIIAFGFVEKYQKFHFLFVDATEKSEDGFYQLMVTGNRYRLYGRPTTVYGGNPTYVLFNPSGQFTLFEPCVLCPWKKQLRELLKDDAKALELVENAPRINIPKFVMDINKA